MTIGALAHSVNSEGPNPDFQILLDCKKYVIFFEPLSKLKIALFAEK